MKSHGNLLDIQYNAKLTVHGYYYRFITIYNFIIVGLEVIIVVNKPDLLILLARAKQVLTCA